MAKKQSHMNFNGKDIKEVIEELLELSYKWAEKDNNLTTVNEHGLNILSDYITALGLEVSVEITDVKKDKS